MSTSPLPLKIAKNGNLKLDLIPSYNIYDQNIKFYAFSKSMEQNIGVIFPMGY